MQYSQEHLKTMVYAEFGGQTECIMGNWKIENWGGKKIKNHFLNCTSTLVPRGPSLAPHECSKSTVPQRN